MSCWHRRYGSWLRCFWEPSIHRLASLARPRHTFHTLTPGWSRLGSRNRVRWHRHNKTWLSGRAHPGSNTTTLHLSYLLRASACCTPFSKLCQYLIFRSRDWWRSRRHESSDCVGACPPRVHTRSVLHHPGRKDDIPSGHRTCLQTRDVRWGQSNSLCPRHPFHRSPPRTSLPELHSCDQLGNCRHFLRHRSSYLAPKLSG